jgi:predicted permease
MANLETIEALFHDVRYGWRMMLRAPGMSVVAVLSLALGIGANAGIFSLLDRVILRTLPVKDPQQLVLFDNGLSYPEYREFRDRSQVFQGVAGTASLSGVRVDESDDPANTIKGRLVSGNYFRVLGVAPLLGRALSSADNVVPGGHPVVTISYGLWQGRFHGDPAVLGETIRLGAGWLTSGWGSSGFEEDRVAPPTNGNFTVIGVMPPGFFGETAGERPDFWAPLMMEEQFLPGRHWLSRRTANWVQVIARLQPSVSAKQAEAASNVLYRQMLFEAEGPGMSETRRRDLAQRKLKLLEGAKGFSNLRQQFAKPLWILMGMVCAVLLIACANLANLLFARGTARRREIGTRLALGVSRMRLVRQLLTESFLLSFLGAALSLPIAWAGSHALFAMVSAGRPELSLDLAPDSRMLLFTGTVAVLTALLFGVMPALRATRVDINAVLKEAGRGTAGGRSRLGGEKAVVIAQVALSAVLLFGTGLFTRTLYNMKAQDLGYVPQKLMLASADPIGAGYRGDDIGKISERLLENIRALPGVTAASYSDNGLFASKESGARVRIDGFKPGSAKDSVARFDQVGPGYFATIGVPILLGRDIALSDTANAPRVAVINQSMAKFYFGKRNPIGQTLFYDNRLKFALTIVGVAKDVRDHMVRDEPFRRFYVSYRQPVDGQMGADYEIRTPVDYGVMAKAVRAAIYQVSPRMPIIRVELLTNSIEDSMMTERLIAKLSVFFGILALVLGGVGLYGIMAYAVARRTQEIGLRMAVGANAGNVVWMVMRDTLMLVAAGLAAGVPLALGLSRYLQSLLFGLKPMDGLSLGLVILAMSLTAVLASLLPARRAVRIDPLIALRNE